MGKMFTAAPVVDLKNIHFSWNHGKKNVLDIPSFQIAKEERIFVKGPSGSGKTTLLGLLGGILESQSGEISILGTKIHELSGRKRDAFRVSHIGFIFQMFNLLPYLSVVENVTLPCQFSPERRKKALEKSKSLPEEATRILHDLGLNDSKLLARSVVELSVGQQQRVAAARALIGSPDILIADEPTSALDSDARESFLELLFQECREFHTTLIFVSHDSALADHFDRSVMMSDINKVHQENALVA